MNKFPVVPMHNNVILKQLDNDEKMYGNILIADAGREKPLMGEVLASGPGYRTNDGTLMPNQAKEGDVVFFPAFGGTRISYQGDEYIVTKDQDLLAVLKEEIKVVPNQDAISDLLKETAEALDADPKNKLMEKANIQNHTL